MAEWNWLEFRVDYRQTGNNEKQPQILRLRCASLLMTAFIRPMESALVPAVISTATRGTRVGLLRMTTRGIWFDAGVLTPMPKLTHLRVLCDYSSAEGNDLRVADYQPVTIRFAGLVS